MSARKPVIVKRGRFLRTVIDGEERLGLAEMVAKTHTDDCVFCGEARRVSKGRPDITCGDEICRGAYHRYWRRDERAAFHNGKMTRAERRRRMSEGARKRSWKYGLWDK